MLTSLECLAKAEQMEAYGLTCPTQAQRDDYVSVGRGWRRTAAKALAQEQWVALHPIG